jgi:hypothetical protein
MGTGTGYYEPDTEHPEMRFGELSPDFASLPRQIPLLSISISSLLS